MVSPLRSRTRRWLESCAVKVSAHRPNPARNTRAAEYLFIHYSVDTCESTENGCASECKPIHPAAPNGSFGSPPRPVTMRRDSIEPGQIESQFESQVEPGPRESRLAIEARPASGPAVHSHQRGVPVA